ncbi:hypothetical protein ACVIRO_001262 [Rhizobium ruizarguesonis]|uniref:hypothetical protein n=1 Tax=Rhizobium leguminosarum TaxID=384 RepID=UPI000482EE71|nr:hypothetical protein [Rhizobium leguminosarum]
MAQTYKPHGRFDWEVDDDDIVTQTLQTAPEQKPMVSQALIDDIRNRREWQNRCPDPSWDQRAIDRNIGANDVVTYLEELYAQQAGSPSIK